MKFHPQPWSLNLAPLYVADPHIARLEVRQKALDTVYLRDRALIGCVQLSTARPTIEFSRESVLDTDECCEALCIHQMQT